METTMDELFGAMIGYALGSMFGEWLFGASKKTSDEDD